MTQKTDMVLHEGITTALSLEDVRGLAEEFIKSGIFSDTKDVAQGIVKIKAGQELNIGPMQSMSKLYIVHNRMGMGTELMAALLSKDGWRWKVQWDSEDEPTVCEVYFTHPDRGGHKARFTLNDAKKAGLMKPGGAWFTYRKAMLYNRAFSAGARIVDPAALCGMGYTPEELRNIEPDRPSDLDLEATVVLPVESVIDENIGVLGGATPPPTPEPDMFPELAIRYGVKLDYCWLEGHENSEWHINKFGKRTHKQGDGWCNFRGALKPAVKEICGVANLSPEAFNDQLKAEYGKTWSQLAEELQVMILENLIVQDEQQDNPPQTEAEATTVPAQSEKQAARAPAEVAAASSKPLHPELAKVKLSAEAELLSVKCLEHDENWDLIYHAKQKRSFICHSMPKGICYFDKQIQVQAIQTLSKLGFADVRAAAPFFKERFGMTWSAMRAREKLAIITLVDSDELVVFK